MARTRNKPKTEKKVTRYTYDEIMEPRTPETGTPRRAAPHAPRHGFVAM